MSESPAFTFRGPWFTTDEAAAYLGFRGKYALRSLYRFIQTSGIHPARRGRILLLAKADLDRAIGASARRSETQAPSRKQIA